MTIAVQCFGPTPGIAQMGLGTSSTRAYVRRLPKKELAARVAEDSVNASVAVGRQFGDRALIRVPGVR
jgi:hypothetical protein